MDCLQFAVDVSLSISNSTVCLRACAVLVIDQILSANMCKLQIQAAHLLLRAENYTCGDVIAVISYSDHSSPN